MDMTTHGTSTASARPVQQMSGLRDDVVEVCLAFDGNFVQHAAVTLLSATQAMNAKERLNVHILYPGDISSEDRDRLESLVPSATLNWYDVDTERFAGLPNNRSHVSMATYLRLLIPETLGHVTSRVIYLDCDTIVLDSLGSLWRTPIGTAPLAASPDEGGNTQAKRLGLLSPGFYFNAGVLIFNLDEIDARAFSNRVQSIAADEATVLELQDQDILNLIFAGQAYRLDLSWNVSTRLFSRNLLEPAYTVQEAESALKTRGILHFTDKRKPWNGNCNHPMRELYWNLRNQTPWREGVRHRLWRYLENGLRNRFSKSRKAMKRVD